MRDRTVPRKLRAETLESRARLLKAGAVGLLPWLVAALWILQARAG